jgi:hypothetical protein
MADFSDVTWREFFDSKRNKPAWHDRVATKLAHLDGTAFRHVSANIFRFHGDEYIFGENLGGARDLAFKYMIYRDLVLDDGGTPSEFERPTADGWA